MSLLAWYPLNKNGNNQGLDGIDLTTVGSVTYTNGKFGKSATFTGSTGIRFRRTYFAAQTGWSCAAWVKCTAATSASQWCFNNGRDSNNDGWHCYFSPAGTTLYLRVGNVSWSQASTLGTWYHVCMTVDDNSTYKYYINGVQKATGTITTLPDYSECNNLMAIGGFYYNGGDIYPLNGQVQDFRYYDHVLSLREVKELAKGLCLHYPMKGIGANPNLAKNTINLNNSSGNNGNYTHETIEYEDGIVRRFTDKTGNSYGPWCNVFNKNTACVLGKQYTWSVELRASKNRTISIGHECGGQTSKTITTEWAKYTHTWTASFTDSTHDAFVFFNGWSEIGAWIEVRNLKIEAGSKATRWVPNVSDSIYTSLNYGITTYDDCSGCCNNATLTGTVTQVDSPRGSSAVQFGDDSGYLTIPAIAKPRDMLSVALWFKTSALLYNVQRLISCTETGGWNFESSTESSGKLDFVVGTGSSSNTYKKARSITNITDMYNKWVHVCGTYDGYTVKIYVNGKLEGSSATSTTLTPLYYTKDNAIFLRAEAGSSTTPAEKYATNTAYSDVRIYSTALSAEDVKALYNVPVEIDKDGNMYCKELCEI